MIRLLTFVWCTGGDLGGNLPAVLDRLHTLAESLTRPAAGQGGNARRRPPSGWA
ncbi:hypothetical protein [Streptomyces sp. SCL15-4]|uniref:hypothetical protein n=1 Tax=Streptomyces sp. SCL15-4 TaxID=2967221 RepID=UPI002966CE94|nr:hypothetical protein [Streptomyces sp. SCL15-4]